MEKNKFKLLLYTILFIAPLSVLSQQADDTKDFRLEMLDYPQSLSDLFKRFEGRVIYIDVMASWCKPCIVELRESKKLQSYFEDNDIVKLYITIDNDKDIDKAFVLIQNESLGGYFISCLPPNELVTSSLFREEIETLFMQDEDGNMDISIPKYAIVNKTGEVVVSRAARPSNPVSLKRQLDKHLK